MEISIKLTDFILENYSECKVPEQTLDVSFQTETKILDSENGQLKCQGLIFPFSRTPLKNVAIKHSEILVDSKNDSLQSKEIREIILNVNYFQEFEFQPGDTIGILPHNNENNVNELLQLMDLMDKADTICSLKLSTKCTKKSAKVPVFIPTTTTPREILRDCLNLKTILKKTFLTSLAEYCLDAEEKKFLKCLASKEGSSFYNELIMEKGLSLVDILRICPSCKPPFSLIVENLTRLLPRPYSIANSPLKSSNEITLIFSTLDNNPGVTTQMLKDITSCNESSQPSLLMYLREPNAFRYTEENYVENQILIAIGTGLAPFLGFLQHKQHLMQTEGKQNPGTTWLFVGSTNDKTVIHREELLDWQSKNVLNKFVECHSRVPTAPYHYVQEALEANAHDLVELLMKPETIVYLCADGGQISKSIEKSLLHILCKELSLSDQESAEMLKDFKTKRKYREDIWL